MASDAYTQFSKLTGAQQTMLSWAKVIESYEELPNVYKDSFKMALGDAPQFPYTVLAPSIAKFGRMTSEKLLCEANNTIHVWERIGSQVTLAEYPLSTISDFEIGEILLFSWITINGITKQGIVSSTTIEFNTATRRHLESFIVEMRPAPTVISEAEWSEERGKFDFLATENFKFMNYARASLVRGERVICSLWQPAIRKPIVNFWGHALYRTRALTHLVILTDKELIIIQDDERSRENRGVRHGGKWRYIPLRHISAVSTLDLDDDLMRLSLTLSPTGQQLEIIFDASKEQAVIQLEDEIEKMKSLH